MNRWLREPLVHFVLIGAAVYLLFAFFGKDDGDAELLRPEKIVVTQGDIDSLIDIWQSKWRRAPTPEELQALIDQYVRETVMYREAVAMGLDQDDTIVRRRLAQKLEFLTQDLLQPDAPDEGELRVWFDQHADRYQQPPLVTFTHVFLDPDKRAQQTLDDAKRLKAELIASAKPAAESTAVGDPFMLQRYYPERSESDLSKLFGREFARSVMELEPGQWQGPVLSGYGVHLVYVHDRREFARPKFEQVAQLVEQDWIADKRQKLNDRYMEKLLERYEVVIEREAAEEEPTAVDGKPNQTAQRSDAKEPQ